MAHQLKYYKEIESHGHLWRVEILQETEDTLTPTEIGPVLQGLRLVVQGDQADVDTPIVKTSLEMTFVDAPDLEEERKCGYWEEFYTSSATEYQVKLYKDGQIEWTGYVTPDSFSEDLRYRGSVSIIARDNLGALQDYTCDVATIADEAGRVEIYRLISRALMKVGIIGLDINLNSDIMFPDMTRSWPVGNGESQYELGNTLLWQVVNADAFSDMNWYEALEKVLYSIGAVLRYVGHNTLMLCAIKDIGLGAADYWFDVPTQPVRFVAYGHRELTPAVKEIKEEIDFPKPDGDNAKENLLSVTAYDSEQAGLRVNRVRIFLTTADDDPGNEIYGGEENAIVQGYTMTQQNGGVRPASQSRLLDISRYAKVKGHDSEKYGKWDDPSILYYALGSPERYSVGPTMAVLAPENTLLNLSVAIDHPISFFEQYSAIGNTAISFPVWSDYAPVLLYQIRLEPFNTYLNQTQWYDVSTGTWKTSAIDNRKALSTYYYPEQNGRNPSATSITVKDLTIPFAGRVFFEIVGDEGESRISVNIPNYGVYVRLKNFSISAKISSDLEYPGTIRTITKYNEGNNIRINRSPDFGINAQLGDVAYLYANTILTKGALYSKGYNTGEYWCWHKDERQVTLPVIIHQQILAYYAKPNNVLTGELVLEGDVPDFRSLWQWGGKDHLLMSGTLNVLTGRMENAVLREFMRYDHMWETWVENEDVTFDYSIDDLILRVHSGKALDQDALVGVPSWIGYYGHEMENGVTLYYFNIMANASGQERSAIFKVDTAYIRVTQRAAGDYGIDYGKDYS